MKGFKSGLSFGVLFAIPIPYRYAERWLREIQSKNFLRMICSIVENRIAVVARAILSQEVRVGIEDGAYMVCV